MVRYFVSAILGAFLSISLGMIPPALGGQGPSRPLKRKASSIAKREDVKEKKPGTNSPLPQQSPEIVKGLQSRQPQNVDDGKKKRPSPSMRVV